MIKNIDGNLIFSLVVCGGSILCVWNAVCKAIDNGYNFYGDFNQKKFMIIK